MSILQEIRTQGEQERLNRPPPIGKVDTTQYVPDSIPLKGEYAGDPNQAATLKVLSQDPEFRLAIERRNRDNNEARVIHLGGHDGPFNGFWNF